MGLLHMMSFDYNYMQLNPSACCFLMQIKMGFDFKGTGSRLSACSLIKLLCSNLLLILLVNNPTHMYLCDLRVYLKVEAYLRVTWSRMRMEEH